MTVDEYWRMGLDHISERLDCPLNDSRIISGTVDELECHESIEVRVSCVFRGQASIEAEDRPESVSSKKLGILSLQIVTNGNSLCDPVHALLLRWCTRFFRTRTMITCSRCRQKPIQC